MVSEGPLEQTSFSARWYRISLGGTFAMFALFLGGPFVPTYPVVAAVVAAPLMGVAVRALRAGVRLSPDGVEVRGIWRTRRASWDQVESVHVGLGSSTGLRWRIPVFVLHQGVIRAEDVRSLREESVVDRVIEQARKYLPASPDSN
jgi:hypothetical protein